MKKIAILLICIMQSHLLAEDFKNEKLVWPSAPQKARIQFDKILHKATDVGIEKGFFEKAFDFVLGEDEKRLLKPFGIDVFDDKVIVTDTALKALHIFDKKSNSLKVVDSFNKVFFKSPIDVESDISGNIYVSDSVLGRVFVFDENIEYKFQIGDNQRLKRPTGIAINNSLHRIYISDTLANDIKVYTLEGLYIKTIGQSGSGDGEFNKPTFLTIGKNGNLYISDSMNQRVQVLDKDGNFLFKFGQLGRSGGNFSNPRGIALDSDENIYVTDTLFNNVQIFNQQGELLLVLGEFGNSKGEFSIPEDIFITKEGKIYVVDSYNMRVQILDYIHSIDN